MFNLQTGEVQFVLSERERYVWQRLGGDEVIRENIALLGTCAQCDNEGIKERGAWFCPSCRKSLFHLGQLPEAAKVDHEHAKTLPKARDFE